MISLRKCLLVLLVLQILFNIFIYRQRLFSKYEVNYWLEKFPQSQIVIGDKAPYFFSDSELYAIVGYKYLRGDVPTNLHPEVPPLGKILIGSSIFIFHNPNFVSLLFGLTSLLLIYILARFIKVPQDWAYFCLIIICLDGQFWDLSTSAMLDIFLLGFLLLTFLTFYRGLNNVRWFILSSLFLGFIASTKLYFTSIVLLWTLIITVLLTGSMNKFINYLISLIVFPIGFMAPYINSFLSGINIITFLKFQRWLTSWWAGNSKVPFGEIFPLIFLNQWHSWWGKKEVLSVPLWNPLWPISLVLALFTPMVYISKRNILIPALFIWFVSYLGFLSITSPFPRYLILLFPFWVLLAVKSIYETIVEYGHFLRRA